MLRGIAAAAGRQETAMRPAAAFHFQQYYQSLVAVAAAAHFMTTVPVHGRTGRINDVIRRCTDLKFVEWTFYTMTFDLGS